MLMDEERADAKRRVVFQCNIVRPSTQHALYNFIILSFLASLPLFTHHDPHRPRPTRLPDPHRSPRMAPPRLPRLSRPTQMDLPPSLGPPKGNMGPVARRQVLVGP